MCVSRLGLKLAFSSRSRWIAREGTRRMGLSTLTSLDMKPELPSETTTRPAIERSRSHLQIVRTMKKWQELRIYHVCHSPNRISAYMRIEARYVPPPYLHHVDVKWCALGGLNAHVSTATRRNPSLVRPETGRTRRLGLSICVATTETPVPGLKLVGVVNASRAHCCLVTK